jgi:hypothetical protein
MAGADRSCSPCQGGMSGLAHWSFNSGNNAPDSPCQDNARHIRDETRSESDPTRLIDIAGAPRLAVDDPQAGAYTRPLSSST